MANQLDQFGIKMIYATKAGAREWFLKGTVADIRGDSRCGGDLTDDLADDGNTTDGFAVNDNGQVRLVVSAEKELVGQGDQNVDQSTVKARGYIYSPKDWSLVGLEMTARFKCTDFDTSDSRFILKGPTGRHRSNTDDCSGSSYNTRFFLAPSGEDSATTELSKEQWHVHYLTKSGTTKPTGQGHLHDKWVAVKYILYKVRNPENTEDFVKIELWINANNDGVTWVKVNETVDSGGWGDDATACGADRDDEIMTWNGPHMIFRWDGPTIRFKDLSIREVDPSRLADGSGEPEQPPTTGTISRDWTIKYNIISFPQDACSLGQSITELTEFYNVTDNGSNSNLHRDRYRVGVYANGSLAYLIGKKPKRVIARLSKTGTLPTGNVTCVLRKGSDDSVAVTFQWTGGANLDANTNLTTSKADYTFENLTNNYAWQNGDILTIEYSGNTTDTTNEVNVFRSTLNPIDGVNTCARKFDSGGPPPTAYTSPDTSRDYAWIIYE